MSAWRYNSHSAKSFLRQLGVRNNGQSGKHGLVHGVGAPMEGLHGPAGSG
jgi:hypothetical protein